MKTKPRGVAAPVASDAPLVNFVWLQSYLPGIGEPRLRAVMRLPDAPKPVLGGGARSRAWWSRAQVIEYFDDIARTGVWPTETREGAEA